MAFYSPQHGTNKPFRWRWCISRTDLQYLCNKCRIVWYPVAHYYSSAFTGNPYHFACHIKWFRGKHSAEDTYHQVKTFIFNSFEVSGIAFANCNISKTFLLYTFVGRSNQVSG